MSSFYGLLHNFSLGAGQANCGSGQACDTGLPVVDANGSQLQSALMVVFAVAAAVAVLMIVIAGLRLVLAQGNPQESSKARSTIIYAVIGLFIALSAEGFVALVLGRLK